MIIVIEKDIIIIYTENNNSMILSDKDIIIQKYIVRIIKQKI